jgi:hypothetical protein
VPRPLGTIEKHTRCKKDFDSLLDVASLRLFSKVIEIGRSMAKPQGNLHCREFGRDAGHASKVLELTVEA